MTTPVPPVLGFTYPYPRVWSSGDIHTAARWRNDMTNTGYLFAGKARPMLLSVNTTAQALTANTNTGLNIGANVPINTWAVVVQNTNSPSNVTFYQIPFTGFYLIQMNMTFSLAGSPQNFSYGIGTNMTISGVTNIITDCGAVPASSTTSQLAGPVGCEIAQFNTYASTPFSTGTNDSVEMYALTSNTSPGTNHTATLMVEWIGLPSAQTGFINGYFGPYGQYATTTQYPGTGGPIVVAPPSGQGTTLAFAAPAGSTTITVNDPTGIIFWSGLENIFDTPNTPVSYGGFLGLDYINGQFNSAVSETVIVASVNGANIGLTAPTQYAHPAGTPVSVPLSAAFMNQQLRDVVNFLAYPPILRAQTTTTQSIATSVFPAGTQITNLTGTPGVSGGTDTYVGFASNAYTVQAAGVYLVHGCTYLAGSTSAFNAACGVAVNGGTIQWGTRFRCATSTAQHMGPTFHRHMRFNTGDVVTLYVTQDSGSAMSTLHTASAYCKLIMVWRSV